MNNLHISVVIPVYGCCETLKKLYASLKASLSEITENYEIIMVNDASPDKAWETIINLSKDDSRVKGINFSRNFGQHYAISAGLEHSRGDWIVVMDCDLQDQPQEIIKLYNKAQEGYEVVFGQRANRQDSFFKKLGSSLFYKLLSYLTATKQDPLIGNFGIYSKAVIDSVLLMKDKLKYFPLMVRWVGFRTITVPIEHASREDGKSAYSISKLLLLSVDTMLSFSDKPLKLTVQFGFIVSTLSFIVFLAVLIKAIVSGFMVPGWASTIMSLWFIGGLIIMVLGIVGIYVGKTFNQVKDRPSYIIEASTDANIYKGNK